MSAPQALVFSNTLYLIQVPLALLIGGGLAAYLIVRPLLQGQQPSAFAWIAGSLIAGAALLAAGFYRGVTIDPTEGTVQRSMGWFMLRISSHWPLDQFNGIAVIHYHRRHQPESGQASDRRLSADSDNYAVVLLGQTQLEVTREGTAEAAHAEAASIAAATGLPHDTATRSAP